MQPASEMRQSCGTEPFDLWDLMLTPGSENGIVGLPAGAGGLERWHQRTAHNMQG